jgi:hypothetical protein
MGYQQTQAQAQRQQAIAAALAQQAGAPPPRPQGRIAANTGAADGLSMLAAALASRRAGNRGVKLQAQADEEKRQAQAAALQGMSAPPSGVLKPEAQSPYARAQNALESGIDPNVVQEYMRGQRPDATQGGPADVEGYRVAKQEGYAGTFTDFLKEFHGRERSVPAALQIWEAYSKLKTPEERAAFIESQRAVPVETVNQVPTKIPGGGAAPQPLSSLATEADAKKTIAEAGAQGTANVVPADARLAAQAKEPRIEAAERRLDRVDAASIMLGSGGGPIEGRIRNAVGTPAAQELEAANAGLLDELTALTRTPGVGSQSDLEARLKQLTLPTATQHPEVRAKTVTELRAFIRDLKQAISRVGGAPQQQMAAPAQPQQPSAQPGRVVSWRDLP